MIDIQVYTLFLFSHHYYKRPKLLLTAINWCRHSMAINKWRLFVKWMGMNSKRSDKIRWKHNENFCTKSIKIIHRFAPLVMWFPLASTTKFRNQFFTSDWHTIDVPDGKEPNFWCQIFNNFYLLLDHLTFSTMITKHVF